VSAFGQPALEVPVPFLAPGIVVDGFAKRDHWVDYFVGDPIGHQRRRRVHPLGNVFSDWLVAEDKGQQIGNGQCRCAAKGSLRMSSYPARARTRGTRASPRSSVQNQDSDVLIASRADKVVSIAAITTRASRCGEPAE
jgi:hypothetical protein